uniref:Putative tail protein n=1 Tax=viral metagenome TaxID=1070528 RepID=A0A6M3KVC8_9ZZZZ
MKPGIYDFTIYQGAPFSKSIALKDADGNAVDLTGYNVRLQARESYGDSTKIIDWSSEGESPVLSIPTPGNGIINVSATPVITAGLDFEICLYDVEVYTEADADVLRILQGVVNLSKEVTI